MSQGIASDEGEIPASVGGHQLSKVGAAPHRPAGHFSPYSDGEKGAGRNAGTPLATTMVDEIGETAPLSPSLYGERMPAGR